MKYSTLLVLLMLSAAALRGHGDDPAGVLTIYTRFAHPPSAPSVAYMRDEFDAIMQPFHLRFNWRSLEHASGHEAVSEVVVVTFQGVCHIDTMPGSGPPSGILGLTHIVDGEILPFADVDCDKLRELMTSSLAVSPPAQRARLLGRAMARVLAHEMYHFLARTTRHASAGLAKSHYTGTELASDRFRFDEAQLRAVLDGGSRRSAADTRAPAAPDEEKQSGF